jgi:hypothetical protein
LGIIPLSGLDDQGFSFWFCPDPPLPVSALDFIFARLAEIEIAMLIPALDLMRQDITLKSFPSKNGKFSNLLNSIDK